MQLVEFEHDIVALLAGTPPREVPRRPRRLAFVPSADDPSDIVFALAEGASRVAEVAGTGATVDDIVSGAGARSEVAPDARIPRCLCRSDPRAIRLGCACRRRWLRQPGERARHALDR